MFPPWKWGAWNWGSKLLVIGFTDGTHLVSPTVHVLRGLVLAGGYGTRLGAIGKNHSKVMLPIADRPVIEYVLDRIREVPEVSDVVVVTNARYVDQFVEWCGHRSQSSLPVSVLNDTTTGPENRLGAVGDIIFGIEHAEINDDLLVMAGDNLCNFPLSSMVHLLHRRGSCIAAYDVGRLDEASKFGIPGMNSDGRLVSFQEKPPNPKTSVVAVAIYMFRRTDLALFEEFRKQGHDLDLMGKFIEWVQGQVPIYACVYGADYKWWDIGDPEIYRQADKFYGGAGGLGGR